MVSRNVSNTGELPENPQWLEFPRSDGDESTWPSKTQRIVEDGEVNFMKYCHIDEPVCKRYRVAVGDAVARAMELPEIEGRPYVLKDWPRGYRMFDHHKGPANAPRHDMYLFGSTSRYRSINEFVPHAHWLMTDPTMNTVNCMCKYCKRTPQRVITQTLTAANVLPRHRTAGPSGKVKVARLRNMAQKPAAATRLHASIQRPLKPLRAAAGIDRTPMNQDRNHDLRVLHASANRLYKRWFREGEIVWGILATPIRGEGPPITFWPCIIEDCNIHTNTRPRTEADLPGPVPWVSEQYARYKLRCLAVSHMLFVSEDGLIPYMATGHAPQDIIEWVKSRPRDDFQFKEDALRDVNPAPLDPPDSPVDYMKTVFAYAVAVQIASAHTNYWTPTDEWEFRHQPQPAQDALSSSRDRQRRGSPRMSLETALNAAAAHNQRVEERASSPSGSRAQSQGVASTASDMGPEELAEVSSRLLGDEAHGKPQTQIRYQGIWWGPERIWVDDLIRLKTPRRALAINGAQHIYEHAPPSNSTLELARAKGIDLGRHMSGAAMRATFMKLTGLVVVEIEREGKRKKECRAVGELYELADKGYEEQVPALRAPQGSKPIDPSSSAGESSNAGANPAPGDALSAPVLSETFPLPPPPDGYVWRRITHAGYEAVISLTLISGRYYPGILKHPLVVAELQRAQEENRDSPVFQLEGLNSGYACAIDPYIFMQVREQQLIAAHKTAWDSLSNWCEQGEDDLMEVDGEEDVQMENASP